MKIAKIAILLITVSLVISKTYLKAKANTLLEKIQVGTNSNFPGTHPVPDAMTFGYANNDGYVLENQAVRMLN